MYIVSKSMKVHNIIAGTREKSSSYYEVKSPYDGQAIGSAPKTSTEEVRKAITQLKLPPMPAWMRADLLESIAIELEKNKGAFASILVAEVAKPYGLAIKEVDACILRLRYAAAEARLLGESAYVSGNCSPDKQGKEAIVIKEPVGVVSIITPFNYPMFLAVAKMAPALAAGNAVVVKSSSLSPLSTLKIAELFAKYFDGSISAVNPLANDGKMLLSSHKSISFVSFTGSTEVGQKISQLAGGKKLLLELGGKGTAFVMEDANIEKAAKEIVKGALTFSGQRCDAIAKVVVQPSRYEELVEKLLREMREYKLGDPAEPMTKVSSLINEEAVKRVHNLVQDALEKGAKLAVGGMFQHNTYHPTLLTEVNESMDITKKEVFGPVISIQVAETEEEMVGIARGSGYGLDSAIFTEDLRKAIALARKLPDGSVTINGHPSHGIGYFSYGGNGLSGLGREGIKRTFEEMLKTKTIILEGP
ncbi:MAG: aldehyde dehydrogenase family protein [Bdellovibrio sp.]|nr:MAG: aldehyde dehydrogenase family protein [Bdellovibrio sp.]